MKSAYSAAGQRAIANADVLIRVFYPNGDSLAITDPEDFNFKKNTLYVKAEGDELWYVGLPFDVIDRRKSKDS